ncbi:MAG: hypothetical protein HXM15_01255 [Fusobacterium periodonticum]|nr:hypothetical protein [Fusobacterium periodonticum]
MVANNIIVKENLEDELYRIELKLEYRLVKLLTLKAELENTNRTNYVRQLVIRDLKKIVKRENKEKIDTENVDFNNLVEYTEVAKELSTSINKLGVLLNQAIRYKVFKDETVAEKLETDLYSLYLGTIENIKKYKKLLEKNNIKVDYEEEIEKVIKEQEEKEE